MKRKNTRIFAAAVICMMALCACSAQPSPEQTIEQEEKSAIQIGLSFDSFVIERWLRDRDVFVSTAEELGAQVNVQNANGDVDEQIDQIRYFIQKKMDVIVVVAIDGEALQEVVQEAKNAGIRVVCYDRLIKNAGTDLYVSFDNEMVGTLMGEHLKQQLPNGGEIFAIYGSQSDNNVSMVIEGLQNALEGSGISIVYSSYCDNWLSELAFDAVSEGLKEHPNVDGIMCGNDDLASQAIRALAEHRLAGHIPVAAQDAELAACQRILEGTQTMTVYKSVDDEARCAAQLSVQLARGELPSGSEAQAENGNEAETGEEPLSGAGSLQDAGQLKTISDGTYEVPYYRIEPVSVTKENLDDVIIGSGFHRREDVYLNIAEEDMTG